jgi:hypothetical protein
MNAEGCQMIIGSDKGHRGPRFPRNAYTRPNPNCRRDEIQLGKRGLSPISSPLAVAKAFGVTAEAVQNRSHPPAFRAWVYLLRRAANLSLREAAACAGVSPGRISQIQRLAEAAKPAPELARLMQKYKVKA